MQVKKVYVEIAELLEANKNRKINTMLPELMKLMESKGSAVGKTFKLDDDNIVTHIYCYYHKEWEDITECEYGTKKGTASGYNTMCKEGVSNWTKQQRLAKKAEAKLLTGISEGSILVEELGAMQAEIQEAKKAIVPRVA